MNLRLHQDNVLILMDHHRPGEERIGSIIVPETARGPKDRRQAVYATVIACGPGWRPGSRCPSCGVPHLTEAAHFEEMPVRPGDRVLVEDKEIGDRYYVDVEGKSVEHRVIRQHQVLGVVEQ